MALLPPPSVKFPPCRMPHERDGIEIVEAGAAKGAVGGGEPGRLDNMGFDAEARAQPQHRAGVLRDIGLIEGDA